MWPGTRSPSARRSPACTAEPRRAVRCKPGAASNPLLPSKDEERGSHMAQPEKVRAVAAADYGDVENVVIVEAEGREPEAGEVRFRVEAAALNPFDLKIIDGVLGRDPAKLPL